MATTTSSTEAGSPLILVTGATGNVGSELVGQLVGAGVQVRALVRSADANLPTACISRWAI